VEQPQANSRSNRLTSLARVLALVALAGGGIGIVALLIAEVPDISPANNVAAGLGGGPSVFGRSEVSVVGVGLPSAIIAMVACLVAALIVHSAVRRIKAGQRVGGDKLFSTAGLSLIGTIMFATAGFQAFLAPISLLNGELGGPPPGYPLDLVNGFLVAGVGLILSATVCLVATVACLAATQRHRPAVPASRTTPAS